jgi:hypothetical protein
MSPRTFRDGAVGRSSAVTQSGFINIMIDGIKESTKNNIDRQSASMESQERTSLIYSRYLRENGEKRIGRVAHIFNIQHYALQPARHSWNESHERKGKKTAGYMRRRRLPPLRCGKQLYAFA